MTAVVAPVLFTEARVNVETTVPGSYLHIPTSNAPSNVLARQADSAINADEDAFTRQCLASQASVFFRKPGRSPRNILWRTLNDECLLTLQSVDLLQDRKATHEPVLTIAISFESPIRPHGVAFADSHDADALHVFVLTTNNELFTIYLRKDILLKPHAPTTSEFDPSSCLKCYQPSSFSFRHPYKLVAITPQDLLVSLHDGGLLRLERKASEYGAVWRETFFSEGGWGSSLRGLLPWKGSNTIRFGNIDLQAATIIAIDSSPDKSHIFTVSLDHTIKAWNAETGKVGLEFDLLGEPRDEGRASEALIDPYHGNLLRVRKVASQPAGDLYYLITHSPKDWQFKFWGVRDADSAEYGVRDMQPDVKLIPPIGVLLDTNAWHITDFDVKPGTGWKNSRLWIRARSGAISRIYTLTFDLLSVREDLEDQWRNQWVVVDEGSMSPERLSVSADFPRPPVTQTAHEPSLADDWLRYLFLPGRFSQRSLDTALAIYTKDMENSSDDANAPSKERLCSAIERKASRISIGSAKTTPEKTQAELAAQWGIFFSLVRHLHQRRCDSLSLCYDIEHDLAWSVRADQVAPIRACSELEIYSLNETLFMSQDDAWINNSLPFADCLPNDDSISVARLLAASRTFRISLASSASQTFKYHASICARRSVGMRSKKHAHQISVASLQRLYSSSHFSTEVSDDDFNRLTDDMQDLGGLGGVENALFISAIQTLTEMPRGQKKDKALTRYGSRVTIRGAQEALLQGRDVLLDLLALVVFISQDLESDELAAGFDAPELYRLLTSRLGEYNVLIWLATHSRLEVNKSTPGANVSGEVQPVYTLFESIFIGDWQSLQLPSDGWAALVTYWSRAWTFGPNLSTAYDGVTAHIMGNLLRKDDLTLAADFAPYLTQTAWNAYLTARMYMARGQHAFAAELFEQGAEQLSLGSDTIGNLDTAGLLSPLEHKSFGQGLPAYLLHIQSLFESGQLPSFAADFALLAMNTLEQESGQGFDASIAEIDRRKAAHSSPAAARVDLAMEEISLLKISELHEEIAGRLFSSALHTSRIELAFTALTKLRNPALYVSPK